MKKLKSLTIFFPFYNDEGTVKIAIDDAYFYGGKVTNNLEVIAIHGGKSKDRTETEIRKAKQRHKDLIIIDKTDNWESYAVIKYGFLKASKEWVFYTDGDLQYHLDDLEKLVEKQLKTGSDIVNGYKTHRSDNVIRKLLGTGYKSFSGSLFRLKIRDTDCDFRLIKRSYLQKITWESHNASILPEMIKKLELVGAKFKEVPVEHYPRVYGHSNYTPLSLLKEKIIGDILLWQKMRKFSLKSPSKKLKPERS